jgi:branched-chain amino acid transport system permease protein
MDKGASAGVFFLISFAIYSVVQHSLSLAFNDEVKSVGSFLGESFRMISISASLAQVASLSVSGLLLVGWLVFTGTFAFKLMWALGDDSELLAVVGRRVEIVRVATFAVSSLFAGAAGCLVSLDSGFDPRSGMSAVTISAASVFFGGRDHYSRWLLGAVVLGMGRSLVLVYFSGELVELMVFSVLLLVLLVRFAGRGR